MERRCHSPTLAWAEPGEPQVRWEAQAMMAQVLLVVPLVVPLAPTVGPEDPHLHLRWLPLMERRSHSPTLAWAEHQVRWKVLAMMALVPLVVPLAPTLHQR